MQLTRAADYAIRVMVHLAGVPSGLRTCKEDIAQSTEVPGEFLSKILQSLSRARLVRSRRGVRGGFELARPGAEITMLEVIEALEGTLELNVCLSQGANCGRRWWCPAHMVWMEAQTAMVRVLAATTLDHLVRAAAGIGETSPLFQVADEAGSLTRAAQ
jgi:Rrf2 family protein